MKEPKENMHSYFSLQQTQLNNPKETKLSSIASHYSQLAKSIATISDSSLQSFTISAIYDLLYTASCVKEKSKEKGISIDLYIQAFVFDLLELLLQKNGKFINVHGPYHWMSVYQGACTIRNELGISADEAQDNDLYILAILHDLFGELKHTGKALGYEGDGLSHNHALYASQAMKQLGQFLPIDKKEIEAFSYALLHHDDYRLSLTSSDMQTIQKTMSIAGKINMLADFLAGAGLKSFTKEAIEESILSVIKRNRKFSLGKWYIYNPLLSGDDRASWIVRSGGFFDGLSALFEDFYLAPAKIQKLIGFHLPPTTVKRQELFLSSLKQFYIQQYQSYKKDFPLLETAWKEGTLVIGRVNDEEGIDPIPTDLLREKVAKANSTENDLHSYPLNELIPLLVAIPVVTKGTEQMSGHQRTYFGWSLIYTPTRTVYDPSIFLFSSEQELAMRFEQTSKEYLQVSHHYTT